MEDIVKIDGVVRHHKAQNGCFLEIKRRERFGENDHDTLSIYECVQCKRETCRCGIEFTYHWKIYDKINNAKENNNLPVQNGEQVRQEIGRETDELRGKGIASTC